MLLYAAAFRSRSLPASRLPHFLCLPLTLPVSLPAQGPYLGEDGSQDAFHTIMQILAARIPHGFRPPPEVQARLSHAGFPCRKDEALEGEWLHFGPT